MKLLRPLGFLVFALTLTACDTLKFSNRLAVTEACDKIIVASWWNYFGIATDIDPRDAEARLQKCRQDKSRP